MADKKDKVKLDGVEGVWRTIGGRRVFIRTGQSLGDAMRESGKFKNLGKKKETNGTENKNVQSVKEFKKNLKELENYRGELEIGDDVIIRTDDTYAVKRKGMEDDPYTDYDPYTYGFRAKWLADRYKQRGLLVDDDVSTTKNEIKEKPIIHKAQGKTDSTYIKDTVKQETNKDYEYKDAYNSYRKKFNETWGEDGRSDKRVSASMYTNDEFIEHLEDANWHTERKQIIDAKLTNKQLEYVKNNTNVEAWGVDLDREKTDKLIKEAKAKYPKEPTQVTKYSVNSISKYNNMFNEYKKLHPNTKMDLQKFAKMMMDLD